MDDRDLTIDEILALNKDKEEEKLKLIDSLLKKKTTKKKVCPRCNGQKVITQYAYYQNGICFMCKGKGYIRGGG